MELTSSSRFTLRCAVLMSMLVSTTISIRVDWNTNTGPIRPPTPAPPTQPPPQRPYAEPAPVWEDQSNDIPNPNPYKYVPPPPSRPRYNQNNDIQTNEIGNDNGNYGHKYSDKPYTAGNFFVDVPPKFYKTASPAKQQYYQQQYLNELLNKNVYSQNGKYNIIAFKNTYHNVPYYVFYFAKVPQHQPYQPQPPPPQQQQQQQYQHTQQYPQQQQQQQQQQLQQQQYHHQQPVQLPTAATPVQSTYNN